MIGTTRRALLSAAATLAAAPKGWAQAFPTKPMRFLVPYPVGGIVDIVARSVAEPMQADLGQPVVVDPKPGGNSTLATAMIPQAPADGYTWVMSTIAHVVVPHLQPVPFDALADFQPVALVAIATSVATVNPAVPVKTLKELVEYGRTNPGKLNYLNPGNGSSIHLSAELLKHQYKFDMTSVPYRGIPPGLPDLLEGRLQVGLLPGPLALQHVQAGKLRALAVLAGQRLPTLPDVPTFAEAGYPEATLRCWFALHGPAGMPAAVVAKLNETLNKALATSDLRERFVTLGAEPYAGTPQQITELVRADVDKMARTIKAANIKSE